MIEELKTFIAVVEFKNCTKAAHYLNLSQPSVSNHIKSLERYFNVTIIDRSIKQKKIYITQSGNILYKKAKEIIQLLDLTKDELNNTTDSIKGHLRIGASLTIGEYILPRFLSKFTVQYPDIEIEVFIENSSSICNRVSNISLDIGFIEGSHAEQNLLQEFFYEDKMVIALPYDTYINEDNFSLDILRDITWIGREKGSGTREYLDLFLYNNKISPKNLIVFGSNYAVKEAVKNNIGVTLMSNLIASSAYESKDLLFIPVEDNFTRNFSYVVPNNITLSRATQVFINEFKKYTTSM